MPADPLFDDDDADDGQPLRPLAGVLAWFFPGLGHIIRGEKRRGGLIMFGILFLVLSGLLVGGVDCVDRQRDRLWFLAQSLCGPIAFAADWVNQSYVQTLPEPERYAAIALNKPNEMGTLFVALAGLMNLVVILDATFAPKRGEFVDRRRPMREPAAVAPSVPPITPSDPGAIS